MSYAYCQQLDEKLSRTMKRLAALEEQCKGIEDLTNMPMARALEIITYQSQRIDELEALLGKTDKE